MKPYVNVSCYVPTDELQKQKAVLEVLFKEADAKISKTKPNTSERIAAVEEFCVLSALVCAFDSAIRKEKARVAA